MDYYPKRIKENITRRFQNNTVEIRKPKQFAGLFSDLEILGRTREFSINTSFSQDVLQLSSAEIEPGMSGSAVLDMETK